MARPWNRLTNSTVGAWLTLESLSKLGDLAAKLAAFLVAVVAANFFVLKPAVSTTVTPRQQIDLVAVDASYQRGSLPEVARRGVVAFNVTQHVAPTASTTPVPANNTAALLSSEEYIAFLRSGEPLSEVKELLPAASLRRFCNDFLRFDESTGFSFLQSHPGCPARAIENQVSLYGRMLILDQALTPSQIKTAIDRIQASEYGIGILQVSNTGRGTARNVTVVPPPWLTPEATPPIAFSLAPGSTVFIYYRTPTGRALPISAGGRVTDASMDGFDITWEEPSSFNDRLVHIGLWSLLALLVLTTLNDIRLSRAVQPTARAS